MLLIQGADSVNDLVRLALPLAQESRVKNDLQCSKRPTIIPGP